MVYLNLVNDDVNIRSCAKFADGGHSQCEDQFIFEHTETKFTLYIS